MSQRASRTFHILLVVAGIALFVGDPIGRKVLAATAEGVVAGAGISVEAFRTVGALLMGAGLLGLSRQQKGIR